MIFWDVLIVSRETILNKPFI